MEKLIELLNEYKPQVHYLDKPKWKYKDGNFYWYKRENDIGGCISEINLISKKFGFIKWLVENDKIDRRGIDKPIEYIEFYSDYNLDSETHHYSDVDSLIMLLSIQDEPIRFLCEILK